MECQDRAFACADLRVRVIYFDLVGQWRQIAQEFEEIERQKELVASSVPISQKEGRPWLTTHAIVGAVIVDLMHAYPLLGLALAFGSHFVLDALPHWDYPIRSTCINPSSRAPMSYDRKLFVDLLKIGGDAAFGIILAVLLFATQRGADLTLILAGAGAGMLPDALQFAHMQFPRQPLTLYSDSTSGFIRSAKCADALFSALFPNVRSSLSF
jgi:hypothetical protein